MLIGFKGAATPPADVSALHDTIEGARRVELPGAGSLANLECREASRRVVAEHLASDQTRTLCVEAARA